MFHDYNANHQNMDSSSISDLFYVDSVVYWSDLVQQGDFDVEELIDIDIDDIGVDSMKICSEVVLDGACCLGNYTRKKKNKKFFLKNSKKIIQK